MKRLACALVLTLAASGAVAQARLQTLALTCQAARQAVARNGAVLLYTGPSSYDRYVASSRFCVYDETTEAAFVPTADTPQCFVGYRCRASDLEVPEN